MRSIDRTPSPPRSVNSADRTAASAVAIRLCCRVCGSDRLATIEQLYGHARGAATLHVDPDGRLTTDFEHDGDTDVDWNSSTTVGIRCSACAWSYLSADALAQLVPVAGEVL